MRFSARLRGSGKCVGGGVHDTSYAYLRLIFEGCFVRFGTFYFALAALRNIVAGKFRGKNTQRFVF